MGCHDYPPNGIAVTKRSTPSFITSQVDSNLTNCPEGPCRSDSLTTVDQQEFVSVGELRQGERVDTEFGQRKIASITAQAYRGVLYNFETTEHVYRIGTIGTLVHNNYPKEIFASDKLDYLFGQVTSSAHNEAR